MKSTKYLDLRLALYCLFGTYGMLPPFKTMLNVGPVLDVVCTKSGGMRGQAHVVFRDVVTATTAMRALQNFMFLDKEMVHPHIYTTLMTSIFHTQKGKVILLQNWMGHFVYVNRRQILQEEQTVKGR